MKKPVLLYEKPAAELKEGDRILASRGTVTEVTKVQPFDDTEKRACVEVETSGILGECGLSSVYFPDESVLVIE